MAFLLQRKAVMRMSLFLLVLCFSLGLAGCNGGPRVVDNQYRSLGFAAYTVNDNFQYLGSPFTHGDVTGDVFVVTSNGVLKEFVVIQRRKAGSGSYWVALKGRTVRFANKDYVEDLFLIKDKAQGGAYALFMEKLDIRFEGNVMYCRALVRNISDANQMYISYGCSDSLIPENIRDDMSAIVEFVRQRFAESVYVPEGM